MVRLALFFLWVILYALLLFLLRFIVIQLINF